MCGHCDLMLKIRKIQDWHCLDAPPVRCSQIVTKTFAVEALNHVKQQTTAKARSALSRRRKALASNQTYFFTAR